VTPNSPRTPGELFDLTGRVAVLTGASGHLGVAMAGTLAAAGAQVWLVGRRRDALVALAEKIGAAGGQAVPHVADITAPGAFAGLAERVEAESGRLDVLVNNAHVGRGGTLATSRREDYAEAAALALTAPAEAMSALRPLLVAAAADGSPSVVNVASMYAVVSPDPRIYERPEQTNPPYYGAVKAGLLQLTRYAAVELAPSGVRVNALTPGAFPAAAPEDFAARLAGRVPLGRVGRPQELATALLFLASPHSTYVTGAELRVDGGWTAW
jgi:NAD(P)-dependent dehydrogenase (short-subunit alcohol dehydrogenase family)